MAKQRFRDLIQPALIDVAARSTPSGGSQQAVATAQLFSEFSRTASDVGSVFAGQAGAQAGAEAGASDEPPEIRTGFRALSAYGKAYNNAALRSYAIKSEQDLAQEAARLETEAGSDPEAFAAGMNEIQKAVVESAPAEAQGILSELYTKRTTQGLARIQAKLSTEIREEDRTLVNEHISELSDEIATLKAQDTQEAFAEAMLKEEQLGLLITSAAADNTISEIEAQQALRAVDRKIIFSTVVERFKNEMSSPYGDPIGFIEELKEVNRTSKALPAEDEERLENVLLAELREQNALASMRESAMTSERDARMQEGDRIATMEMLSGDLSTNGLLRKLENEEITPGLARTLLNELQSQTTAPPRSNQQELASVRLNLLSLTEEEILTNRELTYDDRADLILKRRDEAAGWKGTQRAREGAARIDRALGFEPGTNLNMLSTEEKRARETALTMWYDNMDAYPPEERDAVILDESEKVINFVIRNNASIELAEQREQYNRLLREDTSDFGDYQRQVYEDKLKRMENNIRELENKARAGGSP